MKQYRLVNAVNKDITEERAAELAYDDCVRIFRGTTGSTPGAIYPKDKAYFSNRAIWQLVENDSDAVHSFSIGKYDPNNSAHIALLSELGILDKELDQVEKERPQI